nr:hypothetical protein [Amycolatopsis panacis]
MKTATITETARIAGEVLLPTVAGGVLKRRPGVQRIAQRMQWDRRSVRLLTGLQDKYEGRPLRLRVPGRSIVLPFSAEDVGAVLAGAPAPFSPSTMEKRAALGHFQPHGDSSAHSRNGTNDGGSTRMYSNRGTPCTSWPDHSRRRSPKKPWTCERR